MIKTFKPAFTLIELLISLIIISLLISAFAPVITKKLKYQNTLQAFGVINCKKFDEKCILCNKTSCVMCEKQLELIDGQYIDPKTSCEVKACPVNCAKCNKETCLQCKDGYRLKNRQCLKYTDAPCLVLGNICIAQFNAGDTNGLNIKDIGIEILPVINSNPQGAGVHNLNICWQGKTANHCNSSNGGYSGCNRTVCTWNAAKKICEYHGWRLPNNSELTSFAEKSIGKGAQGLQLCDHLTGASAQCEDGVFCQKSQTGGCYPDAIWSNDKLDDTTAYFYYLHTLGRLTATEGGHKVSAAFSVRCVRDL